MIEAADFVARWFGRIFLSLVAIGLVIMWSTMAWDAWKKRRRRRRVRLLR